MVDVFDVSDDESEKTTDTATDAKKKKSTGLPDIEGEESVEIFVSRYKKALLNRRTLIKDVKDRLKDEGCASHESLAFMFMLPLPVFALLAGSGSTCKPEGGHEKP